MKNFETALQYHIDHKLRRVSVKYTSQLSAAEKQRLQDCLNLHYRLGSIRMNSVFGHQSLTEALKQIDDMQPSHSRFHWGSLKMAATAMASLVLLMAIGGFSWISSNQSNGSFNQADVKPNGTVDNLSNLNLVDAENDSKITQDNTSSTTTVESNLAKTSTIDEAINEDF